MSQIRIFNFSSHIPLTERFAIVNLKEGFNDLEAYIYKEGYYCFLLLDKGEAELSVGGQNSKVKAPVLICGLPGDTWEWKFTRNLEGDFVCFDAETLMAGLKGGFTLDPIPFLNPENRFPFIPLSEKRWERLRLLVDEMKECLWEKPIYYDLIRAELWQFIFLAEKEYMLNGNKGRAKNKQNQLMQFIKLVNKQYISHHDTLYYAEEMHITPNYLNKIVNSQIGISAYKYILNRIISEAKILLKLTPITVNELAYYLGYDNPNYFIRLFKKSEGMTPLEYQKRGTL